jgi:hypothetical protein
MDPDLGTGGEHRYFEAHRVKGAPGAGEIVRINVEIDGGMVSTWRPGKGIILDEAHLLKFVWFWNHGERG